MIHKDSFWVTGIGRSGTTKTADLLTSVTGRLVRHEGVEAKSAVLSHPFIPFPISRFDTGRPYGECHGILRYSLSAWHFGDERLVPHRAIIYRDLRKVVTSWMNHDRRHCTELGAVIYEVCHQWMLLELYARSDSGCLIFDFEEMMSRTAMLQCFFNHLGMSDVFAVKGHQYKVINPTVNRQFAWTLETEALFCRTNERLWKSANSSSNYVKPNE